MDNLKKPTICKKETMDLMFEVPKLIDDAKTNYAGGLMLLEYKGHKTIEHGGADASFRSNSLSFPDDNIEIVMFSNTDVYPMAALSYSVADVIFGNETKTMIPLQFSILNYDGGAITGNYIVKIGGVAAVKFDIYELDGSFYAKNEDLPLPVRIIGENRIEIYLRAFPYYGGDSLTLEKIDSFKVASNDSRTYEGRYYSDELDKIFTISKVNEELFINHSRNETHKLYEMEDGKLIFGDLMINKIGFTEESGQITGFDLESSRLKISFKKVNMQ